RGHTVLLFQNNYLFSGDHLWWSDERNSLSASSSVCWYSWAEQTASMEKLLGYDFEWVLPGHGRRAHAEKHEMKRYLVDCLVRMGRQTTHSTMWTQSRWLRYRSVTCRRCAL